MLERERPAWAERMSFDEERLVERLVPVARALAEVAGLRGITLRQLRGAAVTAGVLTGQELPSQLHCLAVAMRVAGLSEGRGAHRQPIYRLLPPFTATSNAS